MRKSHGSSGGGLCLKRKMIEFVQTYLSIRKQLRSTVEVLHLALSCAVLLQTCIDVDDALSVFVRLCVHAVLFTIATRQKAHQDDACLRILLLQQCDNTLNSAPRTKLDCELSMSND